MAGDTLSVAFLPAGRITGKGHATMVRKYYKHWASEYKGVFHDGETALHSPPAQAAYSAVGAPCNKLPPYSPDLNPIENTWALLDRRMAATHPGGWEGEKSFRRRVRNAVCWLNANRSDELGNMVASMPKRMKMCIERKGAMTEY